MVDEAFLAGWVRRLREEEPKAVAVLLTGSYARGDAGPHSDVDLLVLCAGEPKTPYTAYLVETDDRLVHVSVGARQWDSWIGRQSTPAGWSFHMPAREVALVLWAAEEAQDRLRDSALERPAGSMELEDFLECACKVKNARLSGHELALRLAAQDLARLCPSVLGWVNSPKPARNLVEALETALALPAAPSHYREDMLACLGLSGRAVPESELYERVMRLATGTLDLLSPLADELAGEVEPYLSGYLQDGTLRRYLLQE